MSEINEAIKAILILFIAYIALIVALAYGGYFVGMVVSLTAGGLFTVDGAVLAEIFAWIGVGLANAVAVIIVASSSDERRYMKQIEVDAEILDEILKEIDNK